MPPFKNMEEYQKWKAERPKQTAQAPPLEQTPKQGAEASMKACPYCGETILAIARKCKHCGSMLDGSEASQKVVVTGADPFRELHAPIAGKKKGKLSFVGYLGIALGFLFMIVSCVQLKDATSDQAEGPFVLFLLGVGILVACYLWARKGS